MSEAQSLPDASAPAVPVAAAGRWCAWLLGLPLAFLWFGLVNHLRVEWVVNPQYAYGWAVPFLCVFLAWQARGERLSRAGGGAAGNGLWCAAFGLVALLYAPIRLVQEANPEWRLISWMLAGAVLGLTLLALRLSGGANALQRYSFPVLFFLVAIPWPTVIEGPLIQGLTQFNATCAVEVLNILGIPALRHGNVIEISAGLVGVEEACSGIRSFQACLMIALFLGAYDRLQTSRRIWLVFAGFALAMLFNLGRTVLLVVVASHKGMPAIAEWHDPAGVTILVGCFLGVWGISALFARQSKVGERKALSTDHPADPGPAGAKTGMLCRVGAVLVLWLVLCEGGVETWYRSHETQLGSRAVWTLEAPREASAFRELPFDERTRQMLRYDEGSNVAWTDPDGTRCQAIFLRWNPGRIAVHLARSHTPEVCLTAAGHQLTGEAVPRVITVDGVSLPFDVYHAEGERMWAYYCLWEDRIAGESSATERLNLGSRLRPVLAGRRNLGQRSLEFVVWSDGSSDAVYERVKEHLLALIRVRNAAAGP